MRTLQRLAGGLLWILAVVVGLVSVVLCVTVILLPLGIPLLLLSRRMFTRAVALMVPGTRQKAHEVAEPVTRGAKRLFAGRGGS